MSPRKQELLWQPLIDSIEARCDADRVLDSLYTPFVKADALVELLNRSGSYPRWIIVRWQIRDLISGASDLEIYPILKEAGIDLYVNRSIHLKLYRYSDGVALVTSGNLTASGLGLSEPHNIEIGCFCGVRFEDEVKLTQVRNESYLVTDEIYTSVKDRVQDASKVDELDLQEVDLSGKIDKAFLLSALPASKDPESLFQICVNRSTDDSESMNRAVNDLVNFGVVPVDDKGAFLKDLGERFRDCLFVRAIIAQIRREGSMRFGAVNDFIHQKCRDVPLPYRWEIKTTTNYLYNWLTFFFEDIEWHVPGTRSQVIYSTEGAQGDMSGQV